MKRQRIILFILLGAMLSLALHITQAQNGPVFRIGVLDGERGAISDGARLAVAEINQAGGVRGADGTFFQLELIIEPISNATTLPNAVNSLNQSSVIAVLGPQSSDLTLNNLTTLQSLNVPVLTPATGDTILTSDTSRATLSFTGSGSAARAGTGELPGE